MSSGVTTRSSAATCTQPPKGHPEIDTDPKIFWDRKKNGDTLDEDKQGRQAAQIVGKSIQVKGNGLFEKSKFREKKSKKNSKFQYLWYFDLLCAGFTISHEVLYSPMTRFRQTATTTVYREHCLVLRYATGHSA